MFIEASSHLASDGLGVLMGIAAAGAFIASPFVALWYAGRYFWRLKKGCRS